MASSLSFYSPVNTLLNTQKKKTFTNRPQRSNASGQENLLARLLVLYPVRLRNALYKQWLVGHCCLRVI